MSTGTDEQSGSVERTLSWSATWGGRILSVGLVLLSAALSYGATPKLSPDLKGRRATERVNVIIQYRQAPTAAQHQKVIRQGGSLHRELSVVKAASYSVPAGALESLAADPDVAHISPDRPVRMSATAPPQTLDYYEPSINAPFAWALGWNGAGIGVAVIDSGVADMPDLHTPNYKVVFSQNFAGGGPASDQYGHGLHVTGILAGNGKNSRGNQYSYTFQGVAQGVNIVNLRVLDQNGQGTDSAVISAIQAAIQLKNTYNIRIINLSLGRAVYESYTVDPLCQAVEQAWQAGIVVVVAAGNDGRNDSASTAGYGTINAPGNDPYVITVGAMKTMGTLDRSDDQIASYSSKGPTMFDHVAKPDIVAPGNQIISLYTGPMALNHQYPENEVRNALYINNGNHNGSNTYFQLSGTSMATPMVSGAAALMLQQNPSLTPDQVKARLMKSAWKNMLPYGSGVDPVTNQVYNTQSDLFSVGAGYLDIQAALTNSDLAPSTVGSAMSPIVTQDGYGNIVLTNSPLLVWGSGLWSDTVVWGVTTLSGLNPAGQTVLWGSTVCWGNVNLTGFNTIWGSTVVWGVTNPQGEATDTAIYGED